MTRVILGALLSLFALPCLADQTYVYRIGWFQASDAECPAEAAKIGVSFASATGHFVVATSCERPFSWKQDVVIQYTAPAPVRLVSTFDEFAMEQGTYATAESCKAALPRERQLFESKTGLQAVTSFCFPESSLRSENGHPFVARVDGFGIPALRPFVYWGRVYHVPGLTASELDAKMAESLATMPGIDSPRHGVDYADTLNRVTVKYFATRKRALSLESPLAFEALAACEEQQREIDEIIGNFGLLGTTSFCAPERFSPVVHYYYFALTTGFFSMETPADRYQAREQCETALSAVEDRYRASTGSSKVVGRCSFERPDIMADPVFLPKIFVAR